MIAIKRTAARRLIHFVSVKAVPPTTATITVAHHQLNLGLEVLVGRVISFLDIKRAFPVHLSRNLFDSVDIMPDAES
jgi:hypothetical protein